MSSFNAEKKANITCWKMMYTSARSSVRNRSLHTPVRPQRWRSNVNTSGSDASTCISYRAAICYSYLVVTTAAYRFVYPVGLDTSEGWATLRFGYWITNRLKSFEPLCWSRWKILTTTDDDHNRDNQKPSMAYPRNLCCVLSRNCLASGEAARFIYFMKCVMWCSFGSDS